MTYMAREPYANFWPKVADTAFVAESADLIGDVTIGEHASVWYHTTLRADINKIVIGDYPISRTTAASTWQTISAAM